MFKLFKKKVSSSNLSRKERSERRLENLRIQCNHNLPATIEDDSIFIRDSKEIASKIVVLWEIVNIANNLKNSNKAGSIEFLKEVELWDYLSPHDQDFLLADKHSKQKIIDLQWRTEVLKVLYWSLNEIADLGEPIEDNTLVEISERVINKYDSLYSFLNKTKRRSAEEILDEADFIYRLHWCSKKHRRKAQNVPSHYNISVIKERDFAFRWLTDTSLNWDEITLDT